MSIVITGWGVNAGLTGVNTQTGVVWYDGGGTLSAEKASCVGDTCYAVVTTGTAIELFSAGAFSTISYAPALNALTPLYGNATSGRTYLVVNSTPWSVHSTVDLVTWDVASFPSTEVFHGAAMGLDGLYVITTEASIILSDSVETVRVRKVDATGAMSLVDEWAPIVVHFPVSTAAIAVVGGTISGYFRPALETTPTAYRNGVLVDYSVTAAANPMSAQGGVYATYKNLSDGVTRYGYSSSGTSFSELNEWAGSTIITQDGIVAESTITGDAVLFVNGVVVERLSAEEYMLLNGALSYTGLVPFWTNKVGCIERA